MKRGGKIFYVLLMAIISFVLFNKFINMEVIDTDHIIIGNE